VTHYTDAAIVAEVSRGLGEPMLGRTVASLAEPDRLATRGW
jgi:pyridoxal 5'-phosphate synthase pdxS subunit